MPQSFLKNFWSWKTFWLCNTFIKCLLDVGCPGKGPGLCTRARLQSLFSWELLVITSHDSFRNVTFGRGGRSGLPTTVSAVGSRCQVKQCFWAFLFLWPKRRSCMNCLLRSLRTWTFHESEDGRTKKLSNWIYLFLTDTEMEALRDGVVLIRQWISGGDLLECSSSVFLLLRSRAGRILIVQGRGYIVHPESNSLLVSSTCYNTRVFRPCSCWCDWRIWQRHIRIMSN